MAAPQRTREPAPAWKQLEMKLTCPKQHVYELIRPVVLFDQPVAERAAETATAERTLYRHVQTFRQHGLGAAQRPATAPIRAAARLPNVPVSRATIFRWQARFAINGAAGFQDQRHGHPWLVTPQVEAWIVTYCQAHPHTPSHALKALLATELACTVSVTHLNRVRTRLDVTYQRPRHEKKDPGCPPR